jgi:hypothetical protein
MQNTGNHTGKRTSRENSNASGALAAAPKIGEDEQIIIEIKKNEYCCDDVVCWTPKKFKTNLGLYVTPGTAVQIN